MNLKYRSTTCNMNIQHQRLKVFEGENIKHISVLLLDTWYRHIKFQFTITSLCKKLSSSYQHDVDVFFGWIYTIVIWKQTIADKTGVIISECTSPSSSLFLLMMMMSAKKEPMKTNLYLCLPTFNFIVCIWVDFLNWMLIFMVPTSTRKPGKKWEHFQLG